MEGRTWSWKTQQSGAAGRFGRILLTVLVLAVLLGALWTWFSLSWAYSEGERAGVLQKFSKKGWICKTYEGELAQYVVGGVAPQIWYFSTRDEKLAKQLSAAVGRSRSACITPSIAACRPPASPRHRISPRASRLVAALERGRAIMTTVNDFEARTLAASPSRCATTRARCC